MGSRYFLTVTCPYCSYVHNDCWYAPTCNAYDFMCNKCYKTSFVVDYELVEAEEVNPSKIFEDYLSALNIWSPTESDKKGILKEIKKRIDQAIIHNRWV